MVDNYLAGVRLPAGGVRVAAYVSNPVTLEKLVAAGMGVAIVSYLTVEERVAAGEVLSFELEERPVERNIYMAWRTKGELTPAAKEFSAFVRKSVKEA